MAPARNIFDNPRHYVLHLVDVNLRNSIMQTRAGVTVSMPTAWGCFSTSVCKGFLRAYILGSGIYNTPRFAV